MRKGNGSALPSGPGDDVGNVMFHREGAGMRHEPVFAIVDPLDSREDLAQEGDELDLARMNVVEGVGGLALDLVAEEREAARPEQIADLPKRRRDIAGMVENMEGENRVVRTGRQKRPVEDAVDIAIERGELRQRLLRVAQADGGHVEPGRCGAKAVRDK